MLILTCQQLVILYGGYGLWWWMDERLVGAGLVNKMMMMIAWNGINRMAMAYRTGGK